MTCARRLVGVPRPACWAGSASRPAPRSGRFRTRLFRLLPALALLFGALGPVSAGPALAQSSDNTLRALTVEVSTDGSNFTAAAIHPGFTAAQRSYNAVVSAQHTHVRVSATATHGAATLKVGRHGGSLTALASGATSAAFALVDGANTIRIQVRAPNRDTESYYVSVTRGGRVIPLPPRYVQATAGSAKLTLTWAAPLYWGSFPAGGYQVDWYAGASPPTVESHWNRATPVGSPLAATATSYEFTGTYGDHTVADGTTYQLRVRAFSTNPDDSGDRLPSEWVTRAGAPPGQSSQSSDARLSGLTASSATSASGPYSTLGLTPASFSASTTSYVATVANARTHVKLTPTANHASATIGVRKGSGSFASVASGNASAAIALDVGANKITVRVTAEDGTTKDYTVTVTRQTAGGSTTVSLSASPNPVTEGSTVTVTATLSAALGSNVTIPVTITDNSAEPADHGTLTSIAINSGATTGTGTITTAQDADGNDETFTVALGSSLPAGVTAGTPSSVQITIRDDDTSSPPTVSLSASPNPVAEGSTVTVTATLSAALGSNVTIPVTITDNSAEPADHGTLTSIAINSGATTGTGTITTAQDADGNDETFTVALGSSLPAGVTAGTPSSVQITIRDDDTSSPPTVSLSASPNPVAEGSTVTVTATLSAALGSNVTIPVTITDNSAEPADHGTLTSIAINSGATTGTGTITTAQDADGNDETFTVALGSSLPAGVTAGTPSSVRITIRDDEGTPAVSLSVSRNPVPEGEWLGVTACLKLGSGSAAVPAGTVRIPVVLSHGTSENGDWGSSMSGHSDGSLPIRTREFISISGSHQKSCGTIGIPTHEDSDEDDETFTVALGSNLPSTVIAGAASSVAVTITESETARADGDRVQYTPDDAPDQVTQQGRVSLSVSRNPVPEGSWVGVTACLKHGDGSRAVPTGTVRIPVVLSHGASENGDWGSSLSGRSDGSLPIRMTESIAISGSHRSSCGVIGIPTHRDLDDDDETFTVALGSSLPPALTAGTPGSVTVTIEDTVPVVLLSVAPNPVAEGSPVRVTVSLTRALAGDVRVPLRVVRGTSEAGDHGTLSSITIRAGSRTASGTIPTVRDADRDDETFTVALGNLPPSVHAPRRSSVAVAVTIDDNGALQGNPGTESLQGSPGTARPAVALTRELFELIQQIEGWRDDPALSGHRPHVVRWNRVLLALGWDVSLASDRSLAPMGAAEAQTYADRGWTRWVAVAAALRQIEAANAPDPAVTIAGGDPVTEGAPAGFTLTASRAPATDLAVAVTVAQRGAFADASALGARTVTIPAGNASASFTVATVDDDTDEADGAVAATLAAGSGYRVGAGSSASVTVADNDEPLPAIVTKRAIAREGTDEAAVFTVRLSRAASHAVSVDWATADGAHAWVGTPPATAGADYTASSGTLTFAAGERFKSIRVPILDDAIDEGMEYFLLKFSNPRGATMQARYRETQGLIMNDDHLQSMWLARFGRTVGGQVTDAVSERLAGGLAPGAHATLAGQSMDLSKAGDGKALAEAMTGLAKAFGAPGAPASDDGPFARAHGLADPRNGPATATTARSMTGRELLLGSALHVAGTGGGAGPGLAAWGRVAHGSFDGEHADGDGRTRVDGEVVTGVLGADAEWNRVLAGVAVSLSEGEGKYDSPDVDRGKSGRIESSMTTVTPYARFRVTERVSAWGLAGWGTGDMTIRFDDGPMEPVRTDLSMQLGAVGARGALLTQDEAGGMDLALKADAFFVRTESKQAANSAETTADASRLRLVLEGGRRFDLGGGATLRPSLELGVRHDGGDAETGAGVEIGGGVSYADAASGLSVEARARMLAAHADSDYREWGASATVRLDPGARGRGLSLSLAPTIGVSTSAAERLWGARDARGLAPGGEFEATRGLQAEAGYGMALFGDRFTGTPNVGFGMSDGGARDYRIGWRLTSAVPNDPGFEVGLDATRREPANDGGPMEHGVMLRSLIRW